MDDLEWPLCTLLHYTCSLEPATRSSVKVDTYCQQQGLWRYKAYAVIRWGFRGEEASNRSADLHSVYPCVSCDTIR